ncbi:MAG TPA: hypothetical protein VK021_06370, partial [Flavobacteriaceae bacterium]|nr:hypothetical protein [Flavobacteriaceae bacterium]
MHYILCFFAVLIFSFGSSAQEVLQQEMGTYSAFGNFIVDDQELYLSKSVNEEEASEIIITENAPQTEYGGGAGDGYFEKRNMDGEVLWNTFFGGEGEDGGEIIGFYQDNLYVLGITSSTDEITTSGVFQEDFLEYESNNDA